MDDYKALKAQFEALLQQTEVGQIACLADIREAVGDNGRMMQDELVAHIRGMKAEIDALREDVVRIERVRQMWKSQCENQARQLEALHIATNAKNRLLTQYEIYTARKDEQ